MKVTSLRYLDAKFHHSSPKIKKIPKNTNGRLAIPALAGLLVFYIISYYDFKFTSAYNSILFCCLRRNVEPYDMIGYDTCVFNVQ